MKRSTVIAHLCIPALLTVGTFAVSLSRDPFSIEMFSTYVLGGYLFYAAPHLLWATIAALAKFPNVMWHAGFIASSIALVAISLFWFFPRDPSGLPIQWMVYWPLAVALQVVVAGLTAVVHRTNAPNPAFKRDSPRSGRAP